jgi:hypothetical protein
LAYLFYGLHLSCKRQFLFHIFIAYFCISKKIERLCHQ